MPTECGILESREIFFPGVNQRINGNKISSELLWKICCDSGHKPFHVDEKYKRRHKNELYVDSARKKEKRLAYFQGLHG